MDFLPSVIRAKYDGGFRIHVTLNDNVRGSVDFQDWLHGQVFEPLKGSELFSAVLHRRRNSRLA